MKFSILIVFSVFIAGFCQSQDLNKYFGQAHFVTEDSELISNTEKYIRQQDGIWMVRIDPTNGNVLIYTPSFRFGLKRNSSLYLGKMETK